MEGSKILIIPAFSKQRLISGTGQQLFPHTGCRSDLEGTVRQVKAHQLSIGINIDIKNAKTLYIRPEILYNGRQ